MRKLNWMLGLFVLISGVLTSCSNDDDAGTIEPPSSEIIINSANGTYLGEENNNGKFEISLNANDIEFQLNITSDLIEDEDLLEATLASSTYVVSSATEMYSISTDSYFTKDGAQLEIIAGELDIQQTNGDYVIEGDLIDENNISYTITYAGTIDIEPVYEVLYEQQNGWYWGDNPYDHPEIAEYMTYFSYGETNNYGELLGDGYYLSLSFFNNMAPKAWEAEIPNQTYVASTEIEEGIFQIASQEDMDDGAPIYAFAHFEYNNESDGVAKEVFITGGSVKVLKHDDEQEVRFNIELEDGSRHVGKYTGDVRQGDEYTVSTLRSDREVGQLDHGFLEFKGESPIAGKENNRWDIYLYNDGITLYPENYWTSEGTGEYLRLTMYSELSETSDIPTGVFPIGEEEPGNYGSGEGLEAGLDFGTWFFELENGNYANYAPLKTGEVTVTKNEDVYTIALDAVDDRDNIVEANYTGELTLINNANRASSKDEVELEKSYKKGVLYNWKKNLNNRRDFKAYMGE